jgi:hypothetical protein
MNYLLLSLFLFTLFSCDVFDKTKTSQSEYSLIIENPFFNFSKGMPSKQRSNESQSYWIILKDPDATKKAFHLKNQLPNEAYQIFKDKILNKNAHITLKQKHLTSEEQSKIHHLCPYPTPVNVQVRLDIEWIYDRSQIRQFYTLTPTESEVIFSQGSLDKPVFQEDESFKRNLSSLPNFQEYPNLLIHGAQWNFTCEILKKGGHDPKESLHCPWSELYKEDCVVLEMSF